MEAYNASRQARLKSLRETRDQQQDSGPSASAGAAGSSSSSIHPFRRAFLSSQRTSLRPTRHLQEVNDDDGSGEAAAAAAATAADLANPSSESSAQRLADSSAEGVLLRRFRNWDPMTGQARDGTWSTVKGIEDEVKGVQEEILREEEARRVRELDLAGIAPKRVNWDLKRDMLKRLKKVERRDREARLILIRQRLKASKAGNGAAGAAAAAAEVAMSTVGRGRRGLGVGEAGSDESSEEESEEE